MTRVVPCPVLGLVVPCLCCRCCRQQRPRRSHPLESHDSPLDDAFTVRPPPAQMRMTNKEAKTMTATDRVWAACTSNGLIDLRGAMGGQQRKWNKSRPLLPPPPPFCAGVRRRGGANPSSQRFVHRAVSSIESYATSPYFRRIFAMGMGNLEERQQADVDVKDGAEVVLRDQQGHGAGHRQRQDAKRKALEPYVQSWRRHHRRWGKWIATTYRGAGGGCEPQQELHYSIGEFMEGYKGTSAIFGGGADGRGGGL